MREQNHQRKISSGLRVLSQLKAGFDKCKKANWAVIFNQRA